MQEIYINNEKLEMFANQEIGLTIQFADIRDIQTRRGNVSNVFSLPLTPKNIRLLGYVNNPASIQNFFKRTFTCDYYENGTAIVIGGKLKVISTTEKEIKVRINSGNTSFFNLISYSLNVGHLFCNNYNALLNGNFSPIIFDPQYIYYDFNEVDKDWSNSLEKIVYPFINYKQGNLTIYNNILPSFNIGNLLPAIKAEAIFDRFTTLYGYTFQGSFLNTSEFQNLALLPNKLNQLEGLLQENDPNFGNINNFEFHVNPNQYNTIITVAQGDNDFETGIINPINPINTDPLSTPQISLFDATTPLVTVFGTLNFNSFGTVEVRFGTSLTKKDMYFDLDIVESDPITSTDLVIKTIRIIDFKKKYNSDIIHFNYSDAITGWFRHDRKYYSRIRYSVEGVGVLTPSFQVEVWASFDQNFVLDFKKTTTNMVHFPYLMFTTKQTTFFKEFINTYGLLMTTNELSKVVYFNKFEDIKKRLADAYELNIDLSKGFEIVPTENVGGQKSFFKFSFDEIGIEGINDGFILIDNKDLPIEENVLELDYGTMTETTEGQIPNLYTFGKLPIENITKDEILPRFIQLENMEDNSYDLENLFQQFNTPTYIPCKGRVYGSNPLTFNSDYSASNLIENHYNLYTKMIESALILNVYAYIESVDVQKFDVTRPIHIRSTDNIYNLNSYYIISKIDKFKSGINQITLQKINL